MHMYVRMYVCVCMCMHMHITMRYKQLQTAEGNHTCGMGLWRTLYSWGQALLSMNKHTFHEAEVTQLVL